MVRSEQHADAFVDYRHERRRGQFCRAGLVEHEPHPMRLAGLQRSALAGKARAKIDVVEPEPMPAGARGKTCKMSIDISHACFAGRVHRLEQLETRIGFSQKTRFQLTLRIFV